VRATFINFRRTLEGGLVEDLPDTIDEENGPPSGNSLDSEVRTITKTNQEGSIKSPLSTKKLEFGCHQS